ncbi:MAG: 2-oxoglutarate dehydrogenase E1 component [Deltaproteobacteria bacterium]|nr:2-oxoglutarate dehydrogenase E1 component [Deltaproteobacteria bacterium]
MEQDFGINQAFVEELFLRYNENPQAVSHAWHAYFARAQEVRSERPNGHGLGNGHGNGHAEARVLELPALLGQRPGLSLSTPPEAVGGGEALLKIAQNAQSLADAFRLRGHLWASLDPLGLRELPPRELTPEHFGIATEHVDTVIPVGDVAGLGSHARVRDLVARMEETYCRTIGVEYMHIEEDDAREWLQRRMESSANRPGLDRGLQLHILNCLVDAEVFEQFLGKKFQGQKRFSLEGAEALIPLLDLMIERAGARGIQELVIGMAHRGRLNVLCNIMRKSPKDVFARFEDRHAEANIGRGDVKYHLGYSSDRSTASGHTVHLSLAFNPSHLEFVNPVVEGRVRAKQERRGPSGRKEVCALLIHGDAAVIGQGVVAETFNLMSLPGYSTGGTLHVVVNNQIGFTTNTDDARSTRYATDLAKMLEVPVFHVNGEDPEAVAQVAWLALDFRQEFGRDAVIDMYCFRRWGHNEGDEPRFTQPTMYAHIDKKASVRSAYVRCLMDLQKVTEAEVNLLAERRQSLLERDHQETREQNHSPEASAFAGLWGRYHGGPDVGVPEPDTQVPLERLRALLGDLTTLPEGFQNPKLARILEDRAKRAHGVPLDWGAAEALAFATLLSEGVPIRLSGQDVRRGTFSHRHAVWTDAATGRRHSPFTALCARGARFDVYDSPLSETGVLGFDYGYSLDSPDGLVLWEAQFGDFVNGAQVIIDQFIASSEDKWNRLSGIVLLLPHGFEGQGPEHSSARPERFLQLASEDNLVVCNLTTPAQLFHALRRQVHRALRKPLVIMTPKSLLRAKDAVSPLEELAQGRYQRVLRDTQTEPSGVRRVLLCTGKVYYDLAAERSRLGARDVAILRLEQLYPLSQEALTEALGVYPQGTDLVWVQEEPFNMGAWYFLCARLPELLRGRFPLRCVSRDESASPATGSHAAHKLEQSLLLARAFEV